MTPDAAERRERALQRLREDTARRMDAMPTTHDDDVRTLIAAHDALADALRSAEARAVAAEGAIAHLSHTLGCESDDPAGIVREALDYAAEQRERADDRDEALAERDAAVTAHAALAGAVRAEREAEAACKAAAVPVDPREVFVAMMDFVRGAPPTPAMVACEAAGAAHDAARATVDALLRGAPGGYVEARVVREYLDAEAKHGRGNTPDESTALDAALTAAGCP